MIDLCAHHEGGRHRNDGLNPDGVRSAHRFDRSVESPRVKAGEMHAYANTELIPKADTTRLGID